MNALDLIRMLDGLMEAARRDDTSPGWRSRAMRRRSLKRLIRRRLQRTLFQHGRRPHE